MEHELEEVTKNEASLNRCTESSDSIESKSNTNEHTSLVVWGNTGRRLLFAKEELKMPEYVKSLSCYHFYQKQWEAVSNFWYNRVLKEERLQKMTVSEIVQLITKDIENRWENRRKEHNLYKKRKRILSNNGPAGEPSKRFLLTNIIALEKYQLMSESEKEELLQVIVEKVQQVTKSEVLNKEVIVDTSNDNKIENEETLAIMNSKVEDNCTEEVEKDVTKKWKAEKSISNNEHHNFTEKFDDRLAVVCTMKTAEIAATAIVRLHKSLFDGRVVLCRFFTETTIQNS